MRLAAPASALAPFLDAEITIVPHVRADELARPFRCLACVREAAPVEAVGAFGTGADANEWSVAISAASVPDGVAVLPGARIDADPAAGRPRLFVNKAARNGALLHLECTARQHGG